MRYLLVVVVSLSGCISAVGLRHSSDDLWPEIVVEARSVRANDMAVLGIATAFSFAGAESIPFDVFKELGGGVFGWVHLADATSNITATGLSVGGAYMIGAGSLVEYGFSIRLGVARLEADIFNPSTLGALAMADIDTPSFVLDDVAVFMAPRAEVRLRFGQRASLGVYVESLDWLVRGTTRYYHCDPPRYDGWVDQAQALRITRIRLGTSLAITF